MNFIMLNISNDSERKSIKFFLIELLIARDK